VWRLACARLVSHIVCLWEIVPNTSSYAQISELGELDESFEFLLEDFGYFFGK